MGKTVKDRFCLRRHKRELKMYKFLIFLLSQSVISQDLTFEDQGVQEGDVGTRFFNVNLGNFDLGGVGESVVGTVIGNAASGFLNDCFGKRKRSIIMDRIVNKRSAQEVSNGQVSGDDVNNRLFCLNNNNNNNRPNCLLCSCNRDYNCRNYCNKCSNYGNNNNFGFSGSSGSSSSSYFNCNTCSCRSNSCFNTCRKCVNTNSFSSSSNSVNCNTCSCSYDTNCRNRCNCYSYGNNNWWNGVRARNEGGQERPSFVEQGSSSTSSNNAGNQGFSSSSNQGSSSDAVVFA